MILIETTWLDTNCPLGANINKMSLECLILEEVVTSPRVSGCKYEKHTICHGFIEFTYYRILVLPVNPPEDANLLFDLQLLDLLLILTLMDA